jgi:hypothetical protein
MATWNVKVVACFFISIFLSRNAGVFFVIFFSTGRYTNKYKLEALFTPGFFSRGLELDFFFVLFNLQN